MLFLVDVMGFLFFASLLFRFCETAWFGTYLCFCLFRLVVLRRKQEEDIFLSCQDGASIDPQAAVPTTCTSVDLTWRQTRKPKKHILMEPVLIGMLK